MTTHKNTRGLTLIELMVVLAVLGILGTAVVALILAAIFL